MYKPWSLYNKEEKLRIDDLKIEQVKIILLSIPTARMGDWYGCMEGDLHWQPLVAISEFYEDVRELKGNFQAKPELAPLPQSSRRPLFEDGPHEEPSGEPSLMVDFVQTKERRTARRYSRQLIFKVIQGEKSFQSATVDVSMAGLSLAEELPDWVGKNFRAELTLNKTNVLIQCARVDNKKLKLTDADSWDVIRKWLVNW